MAVRNLPFLFRPKRVSLREIQPETLSLTVIRPAATLRVLLPIKQGSGKLPGHCSGVTKLPGRACGIPDLAVHRSAVDPTVLDQWSAIRKRSQRLVACL